MADSAHVNRNSLKTHPLSSLTAFLFLVVSGTGQSRGADVSATLPLYSFNHHPLAQIFGLPAPGPACVLNEGERETQFALNLATHFVNESRGGEQLTLDGETHRATLVYRQGLGRGYEWSMELPVVSQTGGFMDGLIINWHDFFGLPQGGREQTARDQLLYRYRRQGLDWLNVSTPASGIGDVRLAGGYAPARRTHEVSMAWRAQLKLPSGDSAGLLGSGGPDLALWLTLTCPAPAQAVGRGCGYAAAGVMVVGRGDVLPEMQQRWVGFGSGGVAWRFLPAFSALLQFDVHSPFYRDTDLDALGKPGVQLVMGLRWRISEYTFAEAGFTEDLSVSTSPDISFMLRLVGRY